MTLNKSGMKHPNTLLTAFRGTSSERLISCFDGEFHKLILENHKGKSVNQLIQLLKGNNFDYVISFGQKPVIRDKLYIELTGKINNVSYKTDFDADRFIDSLTRFGFSVHTSNNAGTSFCNNIYAHGLKFIKENTLKTRMIFVHVPFEKNISDFGDFSDKLIKAAEELINSRI